jgi:hypothetical protein
MKGPKNYRYSSRAKATPPLIQQKSVRFHIEVDNVEESKPILGNFFCYLYLDSSKQSSSQIT